jgi:hypothetical protein
MTASSRSTVFALVAGRTRTRPEYLGWFLARYGEAEKKTDRDLARLLGVSTHDFHRLQLCLSPRHQLFSADVKQIADHFGIDPTGLAKVIRHVGALEAMKGDRVANRDSDVGLLMAARARNNRDKVSKKRKKNGKHSKS